MTLSQLESIRIARQQLLDSPNPNDHKTAALLDWAVTAEPAPSRNAEFADWMLHGIEISGEAADGFKLNAAVRDVLVERQRQISIEGWSTEHDDRYKSGELASASAAYSAAAAEQLSGWDGEMIPPRWWPWDPLWWRPADPRRNLVKAVALGLAQIESLDRATV